MRKPGVCGIESILISASILVLTCDTAFGQTGWSDGASAGSGMLVSAGSSSSYETLQNWLAVFEEANDPTHQNGQTGDQQAASPSSSQQQDQSKPAADAAIRWHTSITPQFAYTFGASIAHDNGRLRLVRTGLNVDLAYDIDARTQLDFNIDYNAGLYSFDHATMNLIPGTTDPFNAIHELTMKFGASHAIDEHWAWFAGIEGQVAGEDNVSVSDAGTVGGYGGVQYTFSKGHSVGLGMLAMTQIEDNTRYLPVINVDWTITDNWRIRAAGVSAEVIRKIDDKTEAAVGVAWERHRFRLSDGAPTNSAVVEDTSTPVYVRLGHHMSDSIAVDFFAGVSIGRQLRFEDQNGLNQRQFDVNSAAMMGVNVKINF